MEDAHARLTLKTLPQIVQAKRSAETMHNEQNKINKEKQWELSDIARSAI